MGYFIFNADQCHHPQCRLILRPLLKRHMYVVWKLRCFKSKLSNSSGSSYLTRSVYQNHNIAITDFILFIKSFLLEHLYRVCYGRAFFSHFHSIGNSLSTYKQVHCLFKNLWAGHCLCLCSSFRRPDLLIYIYGTHVALAPAAPPHCLTPNGSGITRSPGLVFYELPYSDKTSKNAATEIPLWTFILKFIKPKKIMLHL